MATYQYECSNCGAEIELEQSIHDKTKEWVKCECGKRANRVFSSFRAIFRGTGWGGQA